MKWETDGPLACPLRTTLINSAMVAQPLTSAPDRSQMEDLDIAWGRHRFFLECLIGSYAPSLSSHICICRKKGRPSGASQNAMHLKSVQRFDLTAFRNAPVWSESASFKKSYIAVSLWYIEGMSTCESRIIGCFLLREAAIFQQVR